MHATTCLLWFRRDLRVHDHPALGAAARAYERVLPVFVLDDALLQGRFASAPRAEFMLGCLRALDAELRRRGSALIVRRGNPETVLPELARDAGAQAVLWTSDVSPYARARDRRVTHALHAAGVEARPHGGNYVVDISRPRTAAGEPYRVFSPFWRHWRQIPRRPLEAAPERLAPPPGTLHPGALPASAAELGLRAGVVDEPIVAAGEAAARDALDAWLAHGLAHYHERQNGMARVSTSRLSPYLRWGCLSSCELERRAAALGGRGAEAWIRQLCWRDFHAHVLLMWPGNAHLEFQPRFRDLEWDPPEAHLPAWQRGETGYPLVDAGMRELAATGWMHNRVRLVVGSFLTKDLHLDWRHGERWFERLLLDGEPAQNNGNWQWIASVGVDPAPAYRRIYNPALQAQHFDPGGGYVRRWVPELRDVPLGRLFEPWTMSEAEQRACGCRIGHHYPAPIIDHRRERERALERYRRPSTARSSAKRSGGSRPAARSQT